MALRVVEEYSRKLFENLDSNINKISSNVSFSLRKDVKSLKELRVAAVMDEFTHHSYKPECQLLNLDFDNAIDEIKTFKPDLLFIESAWEGKDKKWSKNVERGNKPIYDLAML